MSNMNSILKKITQVNKALELTAHQIHLGAAEDIAKAKADLDNTLKAIDAEIAKLKIADDNIAKAKIAADKLIKDSQSAADKAAGLGDKYAASVDKMLLKIGGQLDKIDKQAKDLGIDPKAIPGYLDVDKGYMAVQNANKGLANYTWQND